MTEENNFMALALNEARAAGAAGEVPVGAVLVDPTGKVLAQAGNRGEKTGDATDHAEMRVLRQAAALRGGRLEGCDLYVTLEPCAMCAGAISLLRLRRLYFGAYDPKGGAVDHGAKFFAQPTCHHRPEVYGGIMEGTCGEVLREFFRQKRVKVTGDK